VKRSDVGRLAADDRRPPVKFEFQEFVEPGVKSVSDR